MFDMEAELYKNSSSNLPGDERDTLEQVKREWGGKFKGSEVDFDRFIIPFIKAGLTGSQIDTLLRKIPEGWELDHREMYFDFRLSRWIRHIEPKDLTETVREYLVNAGSLEEGALHVQKVLANLSKNLGKTGN